MRDHVAGKAPEEACGLVAGIGERAIHIFEIENELHCAARYRLAPKQQLEAFMQMEREGWVLLAIYHSHPDGPPGPSATDLAEALYPDALQLIWSPEGQEWSGRAFRFAEGGAVEVEVAVEGSD
jgi:proteasome lid subunit RPN8/RPN11